MTTYYKYKFKCLTEDADKYWILPETDAEPTTCPTDTSHTISSIITIDGIISDAIVQIQEESTPTGGNFGTKTVTVNATKNTTTSDALTWPFPISALAVEFVSEENHRGDIITMTVGEDTIIGAIGAVVSPASAWSAQNYTVGQIVTYNTRTYTCIQDTVSNDIPLNTAYWTHGYELTVQDTVIANTQTGFYIKLDDLTNSDDMGRVLFVDKSHYKIYVENNPVNTYSPLSPTYVRNTVKPIIDFTISAPWMQVIGSNKIGGSYVPANVEVRLYYQNNSADTDKIFVGAVEYLY